MQKQSLKEQAEEQTVYVGAIRNRAFFELYSDDELQSEAIETVERRLGSRSKWFEWLGKMPVNRNPNLGLKFYAYDLQKLTLLCTESWSKSKTATTLNTESPIGSGFGASTCLRRTAATARFRASHC